MLPASNCTFANNYFEYFYWYMMLSVKQLILYGFIWSLNNKTIFFFTSVGNRGKIGDQVHICSCKMEPISSDLIASMSNLHALAPHSIRYHVWKTSQSSSRMNSFCGWGSVCFFVCVCVCSVLFIEKEWGERMRLNDDCFFSFFAWFQLVWFCASLHCAVFWCIDKVTYKCSASVCNRTCWTAHISFMKVWVLGRVYIYRYSCNTLKCV